GLRAPAPVSGASLAALAAAVRAGAAPAAGSVLGATGQALRLALPEARVGERLATVEGGLVEVVGFDGGEAIALPLRPLGTVRAGLALNRVAGMPLLAAGDAMLGRVIDALGDPIDGGPPLPTADWPLRRPPPDPLTRAPVDQPLALGVRVIDGLCTLGLGQRLALEAGPGAGKSTLLAQMAAGADVDVVVVGLIGERGREVGDFVRRLSPVARRRTVVLVASADAPPLAWLRGAEAATAIAERFRSEGRSVLLLLDSLTRVARAVRTVGVAAGEPTTRRGFPASLDPTLAALIERAANDAHGRLTAVYAVLVEGQAADDPVAELARALLDGHLVLDAALAGAGRFPAVAVGESVSRCMADVAALEHQRAAAAVRRLCAALARTRDLVDVGAYHRGADADTDRALDRHAALEAFLRQGPDEDTPLAETVRRLRALAA
ncbi:MAG: EscN/YscN/HrcN family type III secretion system ATPase, partial [Myxococcales bacterium]|nr:EscN/YscN/HrcN family type III secretion system ATPase [Myxococcales bacterium]